MSSGEKIRGGRNLSSEEVGRFAELLADQGHARKNTDKQDVQWSWDLVDRGGYWHFDMIQAMNLSFLSATSLSPRFTDWLAVGWEIRSRLDSSDVLTPSSRAAQ